MDATEAEQTGPQPVTPAAPQVATDPAKHFWGQFQNAFDMSQVKPHRCLVNLVNIGDYLHCVDGNHGMRVPPGMILTKTEDGEWKLEKIKVIKTLLTAKRKRDTVSSGEDTSL